MLYMAMTEFEKVNLSFYVIYIDPRVFIIWSTAAYFQVGFKFHMLDPPK